jgi:hypothetical protein
LLSSCAVRRSRTSAPLANECVLASKQRAPKLAGHGLRMLALVASIACASGCDGPSNALKVEWAGQGTARVTSDPPGLDCNGPCEARFPTGTTVTLHVAPGYRTSFLGWDGCAAPDTCEVTLDVDRTVTLTLDHDRPIRLSDDDRDPQLLLREDGLAVDFYEHGGVRSEVAVQPGSGVFYFEGRRLVDELGDYGFGVATRAVPVVETGIGETDQSFGVMVDGSVYYAGEWQARIDATNEGYGIVVDYRGRTPTAHVIARGADGHARVMTSQELRAITAPLYMFVAGSKRAPTWHIELNPGNDTVNVPFAYDAAAALRDARLSDVADALTLGWGSTFAGEPDDPPVLHVPNDMDVSSGTPVTLEATATDTEDGDLTSHIEWELLSSPHYAGRVRAKGGTFAFTPSAVGIHPARATITDAAGHRVEATVRVRVPGPVAMIDHPRLEPDARSGPEVVVSRDGLSARWGGEDKNGVRANQSIYGAFWYFEFERLHDVVNEGGGVVTGDGDIGPYSWADVAASCSVNVSDGAYYDLIWQLDFPETPATYDHYGFAVDYRSEHPTVYVIAGGDVLDAIVLRDAWVELYPVIYGNETGTTPDGEYDEAINFGERPFAYDPVAALRAYGVDPSGLVVGWGRAAE